MLAQIHCTDSEHDLAGRYLLLDEPTSCHGHAQQHAIIEVARRAAERGAGAVVILHDLDLAAMYGDRIVVLAGGRVLSEGAPEKVLTELTVRRAFGLSASVTPLPPRGASGNAQDPSFAVWASHFEASRGSLASSMGGTGVARLCPSMRSWSLKAFH